MAFYIDHKEDRRRLTLEGGVTIQHAQDLTASLAHDIELGMAVTVDTRNLEDIDSCILQLLCSLNKTVPGLSFESPSPAFLAAVDRCGLRRELPGLRGIV